MQKQLSGQFTALALVIYPVSSDMTSSEFANFCKVFE